MNAPMVNKLVLNVTSLLSNCLYPQITHID